MVDPAAERVAVVVPTRDRPEHLRHLVGGLVDATGSGDEVVVVDSASQSPGAVDPARAVGLAVLRADRPGASRARNVGVAGTEAPIVVFTDDDCVPRPGWLDVVRSAFADPTVAFVAGSARSDREGGPVVSVTTTDEPRRFDSVVDPAEVGHAANLAVRRAWLERVGGWDEALGAGAPLRAAEDQDLVFRLLLAGAQGRFEPGAEVVHRQWRTTAQALRLEYAYGIGSGALVVKARRLARPFGTSMLRDRMWRQGVRAVLTSLRHGHPRAAAHGAIRIIGMVVGLVRASRLAVRDGRFAPRRATA